MEALFGDTSPSFVNRRPQNDDNRSAMAVFPRTLLPWSVIHRPSSGMWIATLQTNQKALDRQNVLEASKSLRAFSMPTEKQAVSLAKAWTPPRMLPFDSNKCCHICSAKFAVFRRPCHCKNCGVCVCKDCTVNWPKTMIPDTYNRKKGNFVNACKSCDWLSKSFRVALLEGDLDKSVALFGTGNINLITPFANVKGELFYPVHCAVLGGNLDCLKFLCEDNCCPIKSVRVSGSASSSKYTPIVTSKGRSLLGIAMEKGNLRIIRYLTIQKGAVLSGESDITPELLARNLEKVLRLLPEESFVGEAEAATDTGDSLPAMGGDFDEVVPMSPSQHAFHDEGNERTLSDEARDFGAVRVHGKRQIEESVNEECKFLPRSAYKFVTCSLCLLLIHCILLFCFSQVLFAITVLLIVSLLPAVTRCAVYSAVQT